MKTAVTFLTVALVASPLAAEPPMRDKITTVLAESGQHSAPPPTAKQLTESKAPPATPAAKVDTPAPVPLAAEQPTTVKVAAAPQAEGAVKLPNFPVTAPLIKDKAKIELNLAKSQVAMRQEEAQVKAGATDQLLNNDNSTADLGFATLAFGYDSAAERSAMARDRLKVLDLGQTVLLTSLATSEQNEKELARMLADLKRPTAPAYMKRQ